MTAAPAKPHAQRPLDAVVPAGRPASGGRAEHPRQGHGRLAARLCRDRASYAADVGRCLEYRTRCQGWRDCHMRFQFYDQLEPSPNICDLLRRSTATRSRSSGNTPSRLTKEMANMTDGDSTDQRRPRRSRPCRASKSGTFPGPPKIPGASRKQARLPPRTARSLRSSAACPPSRGRPGISGPRWMTAVRAWLTSRAARHARPARTHAVSESWPAAATASAVPGPGGCAARGAGARRKVRDGRCRSASGPMWSGPRSAGR